MVRTTTKVGPRGVGAASGGGDLARADRVTIGVGLEDVGRPHRAHPVAHHRRPVAVDDGERQSGLVVLPRDDAVEPVVGEEAGPVLQPVVVDGVRVGRVEPCDVRRQRVCGPDHSAMQSRHARQKPRTAASVTRDAPAGSIAVPPIRMKLRPSGALLVAVSMKPPMQPSSIET